MAFHITWKQNKPCACYGAQHRSCGPNCSYYGMGPREPVESIYSIMHRVPRTLGRLRFKRVFRWCMHQKPPFKFFILSNNASITASNMLLCHILLVQLHRSVKVLFWIKVLFCSLPCFTLQNSYYCMWIYDVKGFEKNIIQVMNNSRSNTPLGTAYDTVVSYFTDSSFLKWQEYIRLEINKQKHIEHLKAQVLLQYHSNKHYHYCLVLCKKSNTIYQHFCRNFSYHSRPLLWSSSKAVTPSLEFQPAPKQDQENKLL